MIRRPGTQFIGLPKYPDKKVRLIGFNFSVTTNFVLEFGDRYIRFWTNGIQVLTPLPIFPWATGHAYVVGDRVTQSAVAYECLVAHTSGSSFNVDLAAGKWGQLANIVDPPQWHDETAYVLNDEVKNNGTIYRCLVNHESDNFAEDLAAGKWEVRPKPLSAPEWRSNVDYDDDEWVTHEG